MFPRLGLAVAELETVDDDDVTTRIRVLREEKLDELELPDVANDDELIELDAVELNVLKIDEDLVELRLELLELETDVDLDELRLEILVLEIDDNFVELVTTEELRLEVLEGDTDEVLVVLLARLDDLDDETVDETNDNLMLLERVELFDEVVETTLEICDDELIDVIVITRRVLEDDRIKLVGEARLVVFQGGRVIVLLKS